MTRVIFRWTLWRTRGRCRPKGSSCPTRVPEQRTTRLHNVGDVSSHGRAPIPLPERDEGHLLGGQALDRIEYLLALRRIGGTHPIVAELFHLGTLEPAGPAIRALSADIVVRAGIAHSIRICARVENTPAPFFHRL